jgi:hypothetical protein
MANATEPSALERVRALRAEVQRIGRLYGDDVAGQLLRGPVDDELQLLEAMIAEEAAQEWRP